MCRELEKLARREDRLNNLILINVKKSGDASWREAA